MGIFEAWKASKEPVEAEPEVKPIALDTLLNGGGSETRFFHDLIRITAEGGDADADDALKKIAQGKAGDVDPNVFIRFHGQFTEHLRHTAKAQRFLSPDMIEHLREGSDAFESLSALFGANDAKAKDTLHEHLLFLSVNDPATFGTALTHVDTYATARGRSKNAAAKALRELKLPAALGDQLFSTDDRKERRAKLREHITTKKYLGWARTIDKYTGGIISRFDAWLWDSKLNKVRSEAFSQIENDHEEVGDFLAGSINGTPEVLAAFGRAARGLDANRSESFKGLEKLINFQDALEKAWNANKPAAFSAARRGPTGDAARDTARTDFFTTWKPAHSAKLLAMGGDWGPVANDFFTPFVITSANLRKLN